jgi:hypothetical protein
VEIKDKLQHLFLRAEPQIDRIIGVIEKVPRDYFKIGNEDYLKFEGTEITIQKFCESIENRIKKHLRERYLATLSASYYRTHSNKEGNKLTIDYEGWVEFDISDDEKNVIIQDVLALPNFMCDIISNATADGFLLNQQLVVSSCLNSIVVEKYRERTKSLMHLREPLFVHATQIRGKNTDLSFVKCLMRAVEDLKKINKLLADKISCDKDRDNFKTIKEGYANWRIQKWGNKEPDLTKLTYTILPIEAYKNWGDTETNAFFDDRPKGKHPEKTTSNSATPKNKTVLLKKQNDISRQ